LSYTA
jgi:hypothetical protein